MRKKNIKAPNRIQGMAISTIILACFLLGAIAAAIAISTRSGMGTSDTNKNKVLALTILREATTLKDAHAVLRTQVGATSQFLTWDTSGNGGGIFNPSNGTTEVQVPPSEAFVNPANAVWIYKDDSYGNGDVTLMNIGTSSPEYVIALLGLQPGVCQQLNQFILGNTTIPAAAVGTDTDWSTATTPINLSNDAAVNSQPARCIQTTSGSNLFYFTVRAE